MNMSSFEALYGRKCNTLVSWDNPADRLVFATYFLKEKEEKIETIKKNLKSTQSRKKNDAKKNRVFSDFKVGEHVFLKEKENIILLRLGIFPKFAPRYCGTFEILEKIGIVSYIIALISSLGVHNVFNVSLLKTYLPDPKHIIDSNVIQVEHKGDFWVEPVCILDQKVKVLRNKAIGVVNVQWT